MIKRDLLIFKILRYLNQQNVRLNQNVTNETIWGQFYKINSRTYRDAIDVMIQRNLMARTSANKEWQITEDGQTLLNEIQTELDRLKAAKLDKPEQLDNKSNENNNFLSNISNSVLFGWIITLTPIIFGIGYYFGTEKINQDNVRLINQVNELEKEKSIFLNTNKSTVITNPSKVKNNTDTIK